MVEVVVVVGRWMDGWMKSGEESVDERCDEDRCDGDEEKIYNV